MKNSKQPHSYHCPDCGWSRVILTTIEDAKHDHEMTAIHKEGKR